MWHEPGPRMQRRCAASARCSTSGGNKPTELAENPEPHERPRAGVGEIGTPASAEETNDVSPKRLSGQPKPNPNGSKDLGRSPMLKRCQEPVSVVEEEEPTRGRACRSAVQVNDFRFGDCVGQPPLFSESPAEVSVLVVRKVAGVEEATLGERSRTKKCCSAAKSPDLVVGDSGAIHGAEPALNSFVPRCELDSH